MNITCPNCDNSFEWEPPDDVIVTRNSPPEYPSKVYSLTCPNPKCQYPLDVEI